MSLHSELNITDQVMAEYSPLGQLSNKYLNQVIKRSQVMTFDSGDTVFEKQHELQFTYYLLKGKLSAKKHLLSSETLDSNNEDCLFPINPKIPDGVMVKASSEGHMLLVDSLFLDRALGWSEAEVKAKQEQPGKTAPSEEGGLSVVEEQGVFDEAHFDWMASLLEFPLFFNLPPSNIELIFSKFEKVEVSEKQVIIKEGDEGDYFYLLISGSARVIIGKDESKPIRISRGSYFGEEALVSDTVRSATVIMNEDGLLARLDKETFQSLLHDPLVNYVTEAEFKEKAAVGGAKIELMDIRSAVEFDHTPLPKCLHFPLAELRDKIPSLDKSAVYYLSKEGGRRSDVAAHILCQNQFEVFVIGDD